MHPWKELWVVSCPPPSVFMLRYTHTWLKFQSWDSPQSSGSVQAFQFNTSDSSQKLMHYKRQWVHLTDSLSLNWVFRVSVWVLRYCLLWFSFSVSVSVHFTAFSASAQGTVSCASIIWSTVSRASVWTQSLREWVQKTVSCAVTTVFVSLDGIHSIKSGMFMPWGVLFASTWQFWTN